MWKDMDFCATLLLWIRRIYGKKDRRNKRGEECRRDWFRNRSRREDRLRFFSLYIKQTRVPFDLFDRLKPRVNRHFYIDYPDLCAKSEYSCSKKKSLLLRCIVLMIFYSTAYFIISILLLLFRRHWNICILYSIS